MTDPASVAEPVSSTDPASETEPASATDPTGAATPTGALPVPPARWVESVAAARSAGYTFFDTLSVTDRGGQGASAGGGRSGPGVDAATDVAGDAAAEPEAGFDVLLHLYDRAARRSSFLRTRVPATSPELPSIAGEFAGAAWHEREAAEMFGLRIIGAADTRPLLLPDGFRGHPLRKDFPLAARGVTDWPGSHEPAEHGPAAKPPGRRRPTATGVPTWTDAGQGAAEDLDSSADPDHVDRSDDA